MYELSVEIVKNVLYEVVGRYQSRDELNQAIKELGNVNYKVRSYEC